MALSLLLKFLHLNKTLPHRLVFFRDGISESQYAEAAYVEIIALSQAIDLAQNQAKLAHINPNEVLVTYIICGKRHHIRFVPDGQGVNQADRSGNCPAGTVLDTAVIHPVYFDFYLQSHGGLQGTSCSTHYNVLVDENQFTSNELQSFLHSMSHTFQRATRSVSIPTVTYYADLVCTRVKGWMFDVQDNRESRSVATSGSADSRTRALDLEDYQAKINETQEGIDRMEMGNMMWWL